MYNNYSIYRKYIITCSAVNKKEKRILYRIRVVTNIKKKSINNSGGKQKRKRILYNYSIQYKENNIQSSKYKYIENILYRRKRTIYKDTYIEKNTK